MLRDERLDCNMADALGFTALSHAVLRNIPAVVEQLLANDRMDPNLGNATGLTPLMLAASSGYADVFTKLLAHRAVDPNAREILNGATALSIAAENGHEPILELLLADERTHRDRPDPTNEGDCNAYDAALKIVKSRRRARFKGLARAFIVLRRMRLRAALEVYAPGGAGFTAAQANFSHVASAYM